MAVVTLCNSCISDDSTYGTDNTAIKISGIEKKYNVISFAGQCLEINPKVESSFSDDDLEYTWYYYDPDFVTMGATEYHAIEVSKDKNLKYEVNLLDGNYSFFLKVTSKSTGYSQNSEVISVTSSSILSKGFYVLKETADGNTDLDMFSTAEDKAYTDLLTTYSGSPLRGKPRALDVTPNVCYVNPDDGENAGGTCLCVTTEADEVRWYRVLDMKVVKDASNATYGHIEGEKPYRSVYSDWSIYYFTSSAVYSAYNYAIMPSIGAHGTFGDTGSSIHIIQSPSTFNCLAYWNEQTRKISQVDYNGTYNPSYSADGKVLGPLNVNCLKALMSYAGGETGCFLMEDKDDPTKRQLYFVSIGYGDVTVTEIRDLDPNSHAGRANLFAVNGQQATLMYCVDNNKLYGYDLAGNTPERELPLAGIPAGETITYIANRWFSADDSWDYLFVGTQNGDTYKVYMYGMVGGEPVGQPVKVLTGKGKLRKVEYADPELEEVGQTPLLDD